MDPRLSFVTPVVRDRAKSRAFYIGGLGWFDRSHRARIAFARFPSPSSAMSWPAGDATDTSSSTRARWER